VFSDSLLKYAEERLRRARLNALSFVFICFICLIVTVLYSASSARLLAATEFYQILDDEELQALEWVKENTERSDVIATSGDKKWPGHGQTYGWWIEGLSERKAVITGQPKYFVFKDEQKEIHSANRIFRGVHIIENDAIRVADVFPTYTVGNPEIAVVNEHAARNEFQNTIFFNDAHIELTFSPIYDPETVWHQSPFHAPNKTMSIQYNDSLAKAVYVFEWDYAKITRSVILERDKPYVDIIYEVSLTDSFMRSFDVHIWGSYHTWLRDFKIEDTTVTLHQTNPVGDQIETRISLIETNGVVRYVNAMFEDPRYGMPSVVYSFNATNQWLYVHLRVAPRIAPLIGQELELDGPIRYYNKHALIERYGVDYIFLDNSRVEEFQRFLSDPEHFEITFENERIVIFRVL
jgi:hypothetical protein